MAHCLKDVCMHICRYQLHTYVHTALYTYVAKYSAQGTISTITLYVHSLVTTLSQGPKHNKIKLHTYMVWLRFGGWNLQKWGGHT